MATPFSPEPQGLMPWEGVDALGTKGILASALGPSSGEEGSAAGPGWEGASTGLSYLAVNNL